MNKHHNLHVHLPLETAKFLKELAENNHRKIRGQIIELIENERERIKSKTE